MELVRMHGPSFDGSGDIVNREVPEADVQAYEAAGYIRGFLYTEADALAQLGDEPTEQPKKRKGK